MENKKRDFLEAKKQSMDVLGFWDEDYKSTLLRQIESTYYPEIISEWGISDVVFNGDKALIKWYKRHHPLSKLELKEKYGMR